ncbi:MAG: hypothetical protein Q8L08_11080 [Candidatus Nanopelagicaceae bacterium]|nr:hypothetical protein [Candidatus Nanopelagicaceae bacterium]
MIVSTMTEQELIKEISKDYKNAIAKGIYLSNTLRRAAVKSKNKYVTKAFDYKSPNHNNWIINIEHFVSEIIFIYIIYFENNNGLNAMMVCNDGKMSHFTGHFLSRFNERFLRQEEISGKDLIKRFIIQNPASIHSSAGFDEYGNTKVFAKFEEGVGLGFKEIVESNLIIWFKTFISNGMLFENQAKEGDDLGIQYGAYWQDNYELKIKKLEKGNTIKNYKNN